MGGLAILQGAAADSVDQKLLFVGREEGKLLEMRQMASRGYEAPMLVFVQSKDRAKVREANCQRALVSSTRHLVPTHAV